jgi:hypothetical protein
LPEGFHLAGMVGHDFFKPYAVTFDFQCPASTGPFGNGLM